jgi:hypothetical protein
LTKIKIFGIIYTYLRDHIKIDVVEYMVNNMQNLKEQIDNIYNNIAQSQWEIMWGKSIEETVKEIIDRCTQKD